jgi:hypothetical protein
MTTYILESEGFLTIHDGQPSQEEIKGKGEGVYKLHRDDGSLKLIWQVARNRKGNLSIIVIRPPEGDLNGLTAVQLARVKRGLEAAAKYYAAARSLLNKVEREQTARNEIVGKSGVEKVEKPAKEVEAVAS